MTTALALGLAQPGDSEAETKIITALQSLADGSLDPVSVAQAIDQIIVLDCQEAYKSYTTKEKHAQKQLKNSTVPAPQPIGWINFLWDCLGKAAMKVPAAHSGQDRLIYLVEELERLPCDKGCNSGLGNISIQQ
ncbi:hypothetical protein F5B20DRAFT_540883 [Whalleya microplaca]|nr:hypothetical protein F5B20DRAFT_540883 [Whalleya microplaca]